MVYKNYYKILDLETNNVSVEQIKNAYRLAAKKYHPDLNLGDNLAEDRLKDINEAYRTLSISSSKRKYDRIWNTRFLKNQKAFSSKSEKGAILNILLGNVEKEEKKENKNTKNIPIKGENTETHISISIQEAFYGLEKKISIRTIEGKARTIAVKIPQGIHNGEKIRLLGQGKIGQNGGKNGDLFIKINIENDNKFKLKGFDLHTDLLLTPWEAALGTRVNVETIDDETKIYIPQGIQSGEKIRIPGKGYAYGNGARGDLVAEVKVMVPKRLTEQEKMVFEKLNEVSNFNPRTKISST